MNKIRDAIFSPKIPDWKVIYPKEEIKKQAEQIKQNERMQSQTEQNKQKQPQTLKQVHLGMNKIIKTLLILLTVAALILSFYGFGGLVGGAAKDLKDAKYYATFLSAIPVFVVCCVVWKRENKIQEMSKNAYSDALYEFLRVKHAVNKQ